MSREKWNQRFREEEYVYGKEPNQFIQQWAAQLSPGRVLAIAEGEGRNAVYLASLGHEVTVWDYAEAGLEKAKRLAAEKGVTIKTEQLDLMHAPWEEVQFDYVICVFGHFEPELRWKTLKGIEQVVKPGGRFLCEVYSVQQLEYKTGGPPVEAMLYQPVDFFERFSGWKIKHFFMGEVEREEGRLHRGLSHVIQFYGVKRE